MGLYERLMGLENFKIPVHQFHALLEELARGQISTAQAKDGIATTSGAALIASEVTEMDTLLGTITSQITTLLKLQRAEEIDSVLLLAESLTPPYDTVASVKTRLGV